MSLLAYSFKPEVNRSLVGFFLVNLSISCCLIPEIILLSPRMVPRTCGRGLQMPHASVGLFRRPKAVHVITFLMSTTWTYQTRETALWNQKGVFVEWEECMLAFCVEYFLPSTWDMTWVIVIWLHVQLAAPVNINQLPPPSILMVHNMNLFHNFPIMHHHTKELSTLLFCDRLLFTKSGYDKL